MCGKSFKFWSISISDFRIGGAQHVITFCYFYCPVIWRDWKGGKRRAEGGRTQGRKQVFELVEKQHRQRTSGEERPEEHPKKKIFWNQRSRLCWLNLHVEIRPQSTSKGAQCWQKKRKQKEKTRLLSCPPTCPRSRNSHLSARQAGTPSQMWRKYLSKSRGSARRQAFIYKGQVLCFERGMIRITSPLFTWKSLVCYPHPTPHPFQEKGFQLSKCSLGISERNKMSVFSFIQRIFLNSHSIQASGR